MPDGTITKLHHSSFVGTYHVSCGHEGCWQEYVMEANNVFQVYEAMEAEGWVRLVPPDTVTPKWAFCPDHADEAF